MPKEKDYTKIVPKEFWNGDDHPQAVTVAELIKQLQRLPGELPLFSYARNGREIIVYNARNGDEACVGIDELNRE